MGVLSLYILLGMLFAFTFGAIDHFGGAPFFAAGHSASVAHCLYYSFVTLTTVGYGDFAARSDLGHTLSNFEAWTARSCENLGVETLDLVQLHCPPTDVYYRPEVFDALDELVRRGRIARYGVSVERVEEALKAIEYPGVASVQIIFNPFRQRPAGHFLAEAAVVFFQPRETAQQAPVIDFQLRHPLL